MQSGVWVHARLQYLQKIRRPDRWFLLEVSLLSKKLLKPKISCSNPKKREKLVNAGFYLLYFFSFITDLTNFPNFLSFRFFSKYDIS